MTSFTLRLIALFSMLLDHIGHTFLPNQPLLRCIGRLAFPIFAFQLAEGYRHTRDKRHYTLRLFVFAILSEIPFDLLVFGAALSPARQNVIWTLLLGFFTLHLTEIAQHKESDPIIRTVKVFCIVFASISLASALNLDYGAAGILQIYIFHALHGKHKGLQAGCILLINLFIDGTIIQHAGISIPTQAFAVLSLIPISLYNGEKGTCSPFWPWFCYLFYPAHMLALALLRALLS